MKLHKLSVHVVVDTQVGRARKSHVQETVPCMVNVLRVNAVAMLITLAMTVQPGDALTTVLAKVLVVVPQTINVSAKMVTLEKTAKKKSLASMIALVMVNVPW
jgi:hypothetical protein